MLDAEIEIVTALLEAREPGTVLEWGAGGSTVYWPLRFSDASWTAVENDMGWVKKVSETAPDNVTLLYRTAPDYWELPDVAGPFDMVLVDGRHRVKCVKRSKGLLASGGFVLLHDAVRPRYKPAWDVYPNSKWLHDGRPRRNHKGLVMFW